MLGECVISLVLSCHSKNLKQQTSVTVWLQLSFIWQAKENTSSRHEGRLTQKSRRAQFWLLLLYVSSPPPEPALCRLGWPGGLFVSPEVLTSVFGPAFVSFLWASPFFVFYPPPLWTLFPILTNIPLSRDERPNSLGAGALRFLWLLPAELRW